MGFHANAMKTHFISAYNYYPKYNLSQNNQKQNIQTRPVTQIPQAQTQVSFTGQRKVDCLIRKLHLNPLLHFDKFTKEEYSRLSLAEIEKLRARSLKLIKSSYTDTINAFDDIHTVVPAVLKDSFDKFFGEGKYVVMTLGRSLSTIGKSLGYKIGEENVVNLPMSWARRFLPESTRSCDHFNVYKRILSHQEHLGRFLTCLDDLRLGKEQVKTSGKSYVLMDYCCSGDSLKGAEFLFKSDYVWGPDAKLYSVDILNVLDKYDIPHMKMINDRWGDDIVYVDAVPLMTKSLCASHLKSYSQVGRAVSLGETEAALNPLIDSTLREERGLMLFRMLDLGMQPQKFETPKLKPSDNFAMSKQKVEPWHDYITQAESDMRNDIQRVNYQLIRLDAMDDYSEYKDLRMKLNNVFNNLTDYYNTYKGNPYTLIDYYGARGKIQALLKDAEVVLKGKGIFAR